MIDENIAAHYIDPMIWRNLGKIVNTFHQKGRCFVFHFKDGKCINGYDSETGIKKDARGVLFHSNGCRRADNRSIAWNLLDGAFHTVAAALVIAPGEFEFIALGAAGKFKRNVGVLGYTTTPFRSHHRIALMFTHDFLDEVGRYFFASLFVLTTTGFHRMGHQGLYGGYTTFFFGADLN